MYRNLLKNLNKIKDPITRTYVNQAISYSYIDKIPNKLKEEITNISNNQIEVPLVIGGKKIFKNNKTQLCPYNKDLIISNYSYASKNELNDAIDASKIGKEIWKKFNINDKNEIFTQAAKLVTTDYYNKLMASTMVGQGKTVYQAEIDAIAELADFLNFNVKYLNELHDDKLINTENVENSSSWRSLNGFIASITPFNFTAIGGNLASAPLLMGNSVIWKPSDYAILSNYYFYELLVEAGMPKEVIQFVPSEPNEFMDVITNSSDFGGLAFTGSSHVFDNVLKKVYSNIDKYNSYPRIVGETGGNNYHFVFPNMEKNLDWIVECTIRGAFEYSGQKCSATSRLYIPESLFDDFMIKFKKQMKNLRFAKATEDYIFSSAVISKTSYDTCLNHIMYNKRNIIYGGKTDNRSGNFIYPTLIKLDDLYDEKWKKEIFGPILTVHVYKEKNLEETVKACSTVTGYNLTGAVFNNNKNYDFLIKKYIKNSVGNMYINDKSTGSVVGQQPFGGFGKSGTNDKAGSKYFLTRFGNNVVTKEYFL